MSMKSKIDSCYVKHDCIRICQGDILRDYQHEAHVYVDRVVRKLSAQRIIFPYAVVMTQDCDLEWDFNNRATASEKHDKYLQSILLCPAYLAEQLKQGIHLDALNLKMEYQNKDKWKDIQNNLNQRYHFLDSCSEMQIPYMTIDFKHYFTVPRDVLYEEAKAHYIGTMNELFREALSQRFAYYLSRIGLPIIDEKVSVD